MRLERKVVNKFMINDLMDEKVNRLRFFNDFYGGHDVYAFCACVSPFYIFFSS